MHERSLSLESDETRQETSRACRNHLAPLPQSVAAVASPHTLGDAVRRGSGLRERAGVVADRCGTALRRRRRAGPQYQARRSPAGQSASAPGGQIDRSSLVPRDAGARTRTAHPDRLVGSEGRPVAALVARLAAGGRTQSDPVRGGAPAEETQQRGGARARSAPPEHPDAAGGGADHHRRRGLQSSLPSRVASPGPALGRTG